MTPSYAGFVNGDSTSSLGTAPTCSTTVSPTSPVGNYTAACSGAVDPNYSISYVNGTDVVVPAPITITASSDMAVYGSAPPSVTAIVSGLQNGDNSSVLGSALTCTTDAVGSSPVGGYTTQCSGATDPNYDIQLRHRHHQHHACATLHHRFLGDHDLRGRGTRYHAQHFRAPERGQPVGPRRGADLRHDCDQLEQRGELRQHVLGCGGRQLRHQLCRRQRDHDACAAVDHGVVGNHDLRGLRTHHHADRRGTAKRRGPIGARRGNLV